MKESLKIFLVVLLLTFVFIPANAVESNAPDPDEIISRMTLDQKLGQLFMPGLMGQQAGEEMLALIREHCLGGVMLFGGRNVVNRSQTAKMTRALQETAMGSCAGIPLLIAIDQEGGVGSHLNILTGGIDTVGNLALGASPYIEDTYESYRIMAEDLRAYGINMALAPVVDILLNKGNTMNHIRSFGSDLKKVKERAAAATRGFQDHGVLANLKHFPGKGETVVDSHKAAPVNKVGKELVLAPFKAGIAAGADSVMIGHEYYTSMDPDNVSTISEKIITGVLKEEMQFEGLILTDSITMGGVGMKSSEASMLSIKAGSDMVLFAGYKPEEYLDAMEEVRKALDNGTIPMERINESIRRILKVKIKYGLFENPWPTPADEYKKKRKDNLRASRKIASHTLTIVKNDGGLLPLDTEKSEGILVVTPGPFFTVPMMDAPFPVGTTLGNKIKSVAPGVRVMEYDKVSLAADMARALELASEAEVVIVGTILAYFSDEMSNFVRRLKNETGKPVIVVGLSVPYDLERFPQVDAFLATYNPRSISLEAAARALFGKLDAVGELPVDVKLLPDAMLLVEPLEDAPGGLEMKPLPELEEGVDKE